MTARWPTPLGLRPGAGEGKTPRPVGPDALAALIRAAAATTRNEAARHLCAAVTHGLPHTDAMRALTEWDAANAPQQIGGAR